MANAFVAPCGVFKRRCEAKKSIPSFSSFGGGVGGGAEQKVQGFFGLPARALEGGRDAHQEDRGVCFASAIPRTRRVRSQGLHSKWVRAKVRMSAQEDEDRSKSRQLRSSSPVESIHTDEIRSKKEYFKRYTSRSPDEHVVSNDTTGCDKHQNT